MRGWTRQKRQAFARRVGADGCVTVDHEPYYSSQALAKQQVGLFLNAAERAFDVWLGSEGVKRLPIKGLHGAELPLEQHIRLMQEEARSQERRLHLAHRRLGQLTLWAERDRHSHHHPRLARPHERVQPLLSLTASNVSGGGSKSPASI